MKVTARHLAGWSLQGYAHANAGYHFQPALYGQAIHPDSSYSQHQHQPAESGAYSQPQHPESGWNGAWPHAQQPYMHQQLFPQAQVHSCPSQCQLCLVLVTFGSTDASSSVSGQAARLVAHAPKSCACSKEPHMRVYRLEFDSSASFVQLL